MAAALTGPLLAACGGGSPAPDDASAADFCAAWDRLALVEDGGDLREVAAGLERVGTPAEVPGEVREGFEVLVAAAARARPDEELDDLTAGTGRAEDVRDLADFFDWAEERCGPPEVLLPPPAPSSAPSSPER